MKYVISAVSAVRRIEAAANGMFFLRGRTTPVSPQLAPYDKTLFLERVGLRSAAHLGAHFLGAIFGELLFLIVPSVSSALAG